MSNNSKIVAVICFLFCLFPVLGIAQITFEPGYFIGDDGKRVTCFIKNADWEGSPKSFEYRTTADGQIQTRDALSVQEFGVDNFSSFVRKNVRIDRSSERLDSLSTKRSPVWSDEALMLKILVEGNGTLLLYKIGNVVRYFYQVGGGPVQQLVYKKYVIDGDFNHIGVNSDFRQQLWADLKCEDISQNSLRNIRYNDESLVGYFQRFNLCGTGQTSLVPKATGHRFRIRVKAGADFASVTMIEPLYTYLGHDMGSAVNFRGGAELEYVLPFGKSTWSIFTEPTIQSFSGSNGSAKLSYTAIELPFGPKHYIFLKNKSALFVGIGLAPVFPLTSAISVPGYNGSVAGSGAAAVNYFVGLGWMKGKFTAEVRYYTKRQIWNVDNFGTQVKDVGFILGYRLF